MTKLLCTLFVLTLLLAPAAALAEDAAPPVSIGIGNDSRSFLTLPGSGLNTDDLYLNTIPFDPQLSPKGDIILYTADLAAATSAKKAIDQYNAANPTEPFDTKTMLKITATGEIKTLYSDQSLPDMDKVSSILKELHYSPELRAEIVPNLLNSFRLIAKHLQRDSGGNTQYPDALAQITSNINHSERTFIKAMEELYL